MLKIEQEYLSGERAVFNEKDVTVNDSIFDDGESPLKECANVTTKNTFFRYKYPLWYCDQVEVSDCQFFEMARAGIWYTKNITVKNSMFEAPKNFRKCVGVKIYDTQFLNAEETFWNCSDIYMENVVVKGDYFAMNCSNLELNNLNLLGNYSFDGVKNMTLKNSVLMTKDAFWNSENVTVYDSKISGEYLGWNSKNLTLINCTIESLQGLCYCENLVMKNCKLINTNLAFEYSSVDVDVTTKILSVKNPISGVIKAPKIDEIILENDKVDCSKTQIITEV